MGKGLGKAPTRPPAGPVTCYNGRHGEPVEGHTEGEGGSLPVPAGHTALPVRARLRPRLGDAGRGGAGPRAAGRLRSARCLRLRVLSDLHRGGARRAPPVALERHGADARSIGGADGRGVAVPHCGRHRPGRRAGGHCPCGRGRGGGRRGLRPLFASVGRGPKLHLAHPHFPVHDGLPAGGRRLCVLLRRPGRFARGLRFGDPAAGGAALPAPGLLGAARR